jgi:hypothetical protein
MSVEVPDRVCIESQPTFGELLLGSLTIIQYQGWLILVHSFFPLAGLLLLLTPLLGHRLGAKELILAIFSLSFTPLITSFAIWLRRRNRLAQGPFNYIFDGEGMRTSSLTFDLMIRWSAIPRVRMSKRFLFVFIGPVTAYFIPLRSLKGREELTFLRSIASAHTDFR